MFTKYLLYKFFFCPSLSATSKVEQIGIHNRTTYKYMIKRTVRLFNWNVYIFSITTIDNKYAVIAS